MKIKDMITKILISSAFVMAAGMIFFIIGFIAVKGIREINTEFIFGSPKGIPQGTEGGVFPAIMGSLFSMVLCMMISSILAVLTAVYNVYFNKIRALKELIRLITKNIAGLPSIIFALFGYGVFIVLLGIDRSLLTVSLTLATMIFPYIEINTEKIFEEIDSQISFDSRGLGVSEEFTVFRLLMPTVSRKILSTVILAGSYAVGATAPVILTGAVLIARTPSSIKDPIMTLPFHLNMLLSQGISVEKAYGTAFVLILLLLIINLLSYLLDRKWGKKSVRN